MKLKKKKTAELKFQQKEEKKRGSFPKGRRFNDGKGRNSH